MSTRVLRYKKSTVYGGALVENSQRRHDITDEAWALLEPLLPGQSGQWGGVAKDNRLFINAVFWILRTGHRGVTYLPNTEGGVPYTSGLSGGVISGYGKSSLNP